MGGAKLVAIALACAAGFPGGIIFPLFFAAAGIAQGVVAVLAQAAAALGVSVGRVAVGVAGAGLGAVGPSAPGAGVLAPATVALMAAAQAATTRTPLATCLLLALLMNGATDGGGSLLQPEPVPQLFTFAVVAAYVGTWTAQAMGGAFFAPHEQQQRTTGRPSPIATKEQEIAPKEEAVVKAAEEKVGLEHQIGSVRPSFPFPSPALLPASLRLFAASVTAATAIGLRQVTMGSKQKAALAGDLEKRRAPFGDSQTWEEPDL